MEERTSRRRARAVSLLVLLVTAVAVAFALPRLRVTTSITHLMPDGADKRAAHLAKELAEGEWSRTLVLDVSGDRPERLHETATRFAERLRAIPGARVRSGVDEGAEAELAALFARRSPTALLDAEDFGEARASERLARLRTRLASPLGVFVRRLAPRDPLGGTLDALEELGATNDGRLVSQRGILFTADEAHALLFLVTSESALDATSQRALLARVDEAFREARGSPAERLETSGVARMTVAAEAQIRGDIERIGGISTLWIVLLFAVLFGSLRMMGLAIVPLAFGSAVAILVTHVVFGEIHGITLAFGTSLLGVGIDYAEHYFTHFSLTPERGAGAVMRSVWPGLWMGALTTIVGFAGMGLTGFPAVRQIAVFSAVAIVAALFATRLLLPPWMPAGHTRPRSMAQLSLLADRVVAGVAARRWLLWAPAVLVVVMVPALARTRFVDDVSALLAIDAEAMSEDARVRERVSAGDTGRFAIVVRADEEEALAALEHTTRALEDAKRDGLLEGYVSVSTLLRSRARQEASFARAKASKDELAAVMRREGFVPEAFAPFFADLDVAAPSLLTLDDLRSSPLAGLVAPLAPRLRAGQAFVVPLRGVKDTNALARRLGEAVLVDEPALLETTYRDVRRNTIAMVLAGAALVIVTLFARYRSPRAVLAASCPALLGAAGAVAAFGAAGVPLNLLHLVALVLVLSMGVDYGIFVVEARSNDEERAMAFVSIVTATSTTLLSFGLLALSANPALRALGATITIGLTVTMLLCPLGLALLRDREKRAAS